MKKLIRQAHCLLTMAVLGSMVFTALIFLKPSDWKALAFLSLAIVLVILLLLGKSKQNIRTAQLIIENQIMHIQPAIFKDQGDSFEVFVSCFGILLASKIIKFNQENIRLKSVELGQDFISLTYGNERRTQYTKLLHEKISTDMLNEIARRFSYETGIVPVITN